jgi:hypothetical protein
MEEKGKETISPFLLCGSFEELTEDYLKQNRCGSMFLIVAHRMKLSSAHQ